MKRFIDAAKNYFQDSYQELKKVTWPTRNQSIRLTLIVLGFCLVAAIFMGALDLTFNTGYRYLVDYAAKVSPAPVEQTTPTAPLSAESSPIKITPGSVKVDAVPVTTTATPAATTKPAATPKK